MSLDAYQAAQDEIRSHVQTKVDDYLRDPTTISLLTQVAEQQVYADQCQARGETKQYISLQSMIVANIGKLEDLKLAAGVLVPLVNLLPCLSKVAEIVGEEVRRRPKDVDGAMLRAAQRIGEAISLIQPATDSLTQIVRKEKYDRRTKPKKS